MDFIRFCPCAETYAIQSKNTFNYILVSKLLLFLAFITNKIFRNVYLFVRNENNWNIRFYGRVFIAAQTFEHVLFFFQ